MICPMCRPRLLKMGKRSPLQTWNGRSPEPRWSERFLVPSQYQAVVTYSAPTRWKAATGYVTTAEYHGEVASMGVENITYTVVYTGESIRSGLSALGDEQLLLCLVILLSALLIGSLIYLFLHRKNVYVYIPGDTPRDYKLVAKFRVKPDNPNIDIREVDLQSKRVAAIEIKRSLAKKSCGKNRIRPPRVRDTQIHGCPGQQQRLA